MRVRFSQNRFSTLSAHCGHSQIHWRSHISSSATLLLRPRRLVCCIDRLNSQPKVSVEILLGNVYLADAREQAVNAY